jgi:hypothetical protein
VAALAALAEAILQSVAVVGGDGEGVRLSGRGGLREPKTQRARGGESEESGKGARIRVNEPYGLACERESASGE